MQLAEIFVFPGFLFIFFIALVWEWLDRKLYAKLQNRVGPYYTGPWGFLQPLADFIKLLSKEDIVPKDADKAFFVATPILLLATILTGVCLLPIASTRGIISFDGDVILAIAVLTVTCILVFYAGESGLCRFTLVGASRALLQLVGYEIPLMLVIASVAVLSGSLSLSGIVAFQAKYGWLVGPCLVGVIVFIIAGEAEMERIPFDIPEAETEIVAGWLTEFSGRKLAFIRLARDIELFYLSGLAATLFLGGPLGPVIPGLEPVLYTVYFIVKSFVFLFAFSTLRALLARFRIDQMVEFAWKWLIPLALIQFLIARWWVI